MHSDLIWMNGRLTEGEAPVVFSPCGTARPTHCLTTARVRGGRPCWTDRHIARTSITLGEGMTGHEKRDGPYILSRKPTYLLLGNVNVRPYRIDFDAPGFLQPPSPLIRMREWDIFTPELERDYERTVARLADGQYLHYLRRRPAAGVE